MPTRSKRTRTNWRHTVRVLAVTLLVLACADLAFPQICGEVNEPLFKQSGATTFAHASDSGEPQPHRTPTEDCFCCCSHIVSAPTAAALSVLTKISKSDLDVSPAVPPVPILILFHPPRLA